MTAQISEKLFYKGEEYSMCSQPLDQYFELANMEPGFESNCSALWRGYVGTWEILEDRLYLIKLETPFAFGRAMNVATFFPDNPDRVFAHWFSGDVRLPQGELLSYVHMGYGSTYEKDLILRIRKGFVMHTKIKHNGISNDPHAPERLVLGDLSNDDDSDIKL